MSINAKEGGEDATFQALIYESSPDEKNESGGQIEFRYGKVRTARSFNSLVAGFGSGAGNNQFAGIDLNPSVPAAVVSQVPELSAEAGPVVHLNSETVGQRRYFKFDPPAPNGTAVNLKYCPNIIDQSLALSWNETGDNHIGSVIYRSKDNQLFSFLTKTPAGSPSFIDTNIESGKTYYYRAYTVTEGKFSVLNPTAEISVKINSSLFPKMNDVRACAGERVELSPGQGFDSYQWDTGETGEKISFTAEIDRTAEVLVKKGDCEIKVSANVEVVPAPSLEIKGLRTICAGNCVEFTAETNAADADFLWSNGQTGPRATFCPDRTQAFVLTLTDRIAGCVLRDTAEVTVIKRPEGLTDNTLEICESDSVVLEGTPGFDRYEWTEILTGRKGNEQNFTAKNSGLYELTLFDDLNNCSFSDSISVKTNAPPVLFFIHNDIAFCENENFTLNPGADFAEYEWTDSAGTVVSREKFYTSNVPGAYRLTVKNAAGCSASDSLKTRTLPAPTVRLEGSSTFCEKDTLLVLRAIVDSDSTKTGPVEFIWTASAGSVHWVSGSELTFKSVGTFRVSVRTQAGCSAATTRVVTSCCEGKVIIPNAFSPHNTPHNNVYRVEHNDLLGFKMVIYNRNGSPIFSSEEPEDGWDGKINGSPAPGGTYRVLIRAVSCRNNKLFSETLSSRLLLIE